MRSVLSQLVSFRSARVAVAAFVLSAFAGCAKHDHDHDHDVKLGLQSWTCREMTFEQTVEFAAKHGIKYVEFFKKHIDPSAPVAENLAKKAFLEKHGVIAYSIGVSGTSLDKEENRKLFEVAKLFGMKVVVVEPKNFGEWDSLEELVKEYDIKLAIHNHGTGTVYGDPATVRKILSERDERIGVCMDIGWITAAGHDALEAYKSYNGRVCDLHFKDKRVELVDGKPTPVDTLVGEGAAPFEPLFDELKRSSWSGVLAIETDSKEFAKDPTELIVGAKAFYEKHFGK